MWQKAIFTALKLDKDYLLALTQSFEDPLFSKRIPPDTGFPNYYLLSIFLRACHWC